MLDATDSVVLVRERREFGEIPYTDNSASVQLSGSRKMNDKFWPVFVATLVAALGPLNFGFALGFTSPVEAAMEDKSQKLCLTKGQFSWFASLVAVGAIAGALISGWAVDYFGRKTSLLLYCVPFAAGWLLISNAKHQSMLYIGRLLTGIAVGATSQTVPLYIAEIASPRLRGGLGSINQLAVTLGVVLSYIVGSQLSWQMTSLFACGPVTLLILLMVFMPETPRWLLANNLRHKALRELTWLRGPQYDVEEECFEIESNLDLQERMSIKEFFTPSLFKPLLVGIFLMVFQQFSGVNAYIFYLNEIFKRAGIHNSKDQNYASIGYGGAQVLATGLACLIVDRTGRRVLLMIGGIGMFICNVLMGLYYILVKTQSKDSVVNATNATLQSSIAHSVPESQINWLAPTSAIVFIILFSVGWGPLPWVLMSEIFPPRSRGPASGIVTLVNWLFVFIVTKSFHSLSTTLKLYGSFWFFGGWSLLSFFFVYFFVPETKGRTLEEVEALFSNNRDSERER